MKASVIFERAAASTALSLGNLTAPAASMRRIKVHEIFVGSEAAPADQQLKWRVQRCTTTGTRTGVTPQNNDQADAAPLTTAGQAHSVDPTYTANAIYLNDPINQKASYRWVAVKDGELIIPAVANNGLGILTPVITSGTPAINGRMHFEEM